MEQAPVNFGEIKVLDEAYFHLGNSGLNVRLVEDYTEYTRADLVRAKIREYYIDFAMRAFQTTLSFRLPLETAAFASWLGRALVRASERMAAFEREEQLKFTTMQDPSVKHSSSDAQNG